MEVVISERFKEMYELQIVSRRRTFREYIEGLEYRRVSRCEPEAIVMMSGRYINTN